jgi:hypothetical protein
MWLAMHSCGYKSNYFDLTKQYQGLLMGFGNSIASFMTFSVPLVVAIVLESSNQNWMLVFCGLISLNVVGAAFCYGLTSIDRIDDELVALSQQPGLRSESIPLQDLSDAFDSNECDPCQLGSFSKSKV